MRDGILSDESVMKMCAEFQPIPLGAVSSILNVKQIEPKLPTKSKYPAQPPARPAFFGAMSNSMAKQMDPTNTAPMRNDINQQYVDELRLANTNPIPPSQPEQGSPLTPQAYEPYVLQESFEQRGTPSPRSSTYLGDLPESVETSPHATPFGKRHKGDRANMKSAFEDPDVAAVVTTTPGSHVMRSRAYDNVVRGAAGVQNLLSSMMGRSPGSSSNDPRIGSLNLAAFNPKDNIQQSL
jgi:hypothetical protein